ncbi:Synaptojanin-1 [Drechslerella dactyloides]|uniref:Synaptojanin-1 n=1 Tax=Drechslerella dactyloides TaxID=74499 RepID=A0AAD6IXU9_DREDA|nr:Synaptojanin-1 [Drechslerella dactyloides]
MSSIPVYLFTFNCARQLINPHAVAPHLFAALDPSAPPPALLAIALQEVCPLSYGLLAADRISPYLDQWTAVPHLATAAAAANLPEYILVARESIGMTALLLFAATPERVANIRFAAAGFGPTGIANKGAVAAKFTYSHPPSTAVEITIVSAHLAAHEHCTDQRNADWEALVRGLVFDTAAGQTPAPSHPGTSEATPLLSKSQSHPAIDSGIAKPPSASGIYSPGAHLLVLGDLNYRTSATAPSPGDYASAFPHAPADLAAFLTRDQLSAEHGAGNTLHGLVEAPVTFPPTYKYTSSKRHTAAVTDKDTVVSKANEWNWAPHRWPSWCDRILWLPVPNTNPSVHNDVTPHKYTSIPSIAFSDHRPVALHASLPAVVTTDGNDIRANPPFGVNSDWAVQRLNAVARERALGYAILGMTTPGGIAIVGCAVFGVLVLWWAVAGL